MSHRYRPLRTITLGENGVCRIVAPEFPTVDSDDPALQVMTDLRKTKALTTTAQTSIDACNQYMILNNVRLLLVTNGDLLLGVITAADILGEKPVLHMQKVGCRRDEIRVADIMTPAAELEVLLLHEVEEARVGDIIETLLKNGRHHAMVMRKDPSSGDMQICGIFSATQIARQIGLPIEPANIAKTFLELERAIVG